MRIAHFLIVLCILAGGAFALLLSKFPQHLTFADNEISYNDKVITFSHKDTISFSNGRNFALHNAPTPYIFVFFGFTQCPDMCPATLYILETLYHALPQTKREQASFLFLTLHPEADTPEVLEDYFAYANLPLFSASIPIGQIESLNHYYGLFLERRDISAKPPVIYHTGDILLLSGEGKLIKRFPFGTEYPHLLQEVEDIIP